MARENRREAVRGIKREIILDAALGVFEKEGLEGASMRQIGEAAGYTAAGIYFHFPSKEAIYGELLSRSLDRLIGKVEAAVARRRPAAERLASAALAFLDFYAGNPRDLDLGFYLFRGGMRPRGLSAQLDAALNAKLLRSLAPIGVAARDLGAAPRRAEEIMADVFAHACGLLLMAHTGRIGLFGARPRKLMREHLARIVREIEEAP